MRANGVLFAAGLLAGLVVSGCGTSSGGDNYAITAEMAQVGARDANNTCYETGCGPPSTYACVTILGEVRCTAPLIASDPAWYEQLFPSVPETTLESGFPVELKLGGGASTDSDICKSNVVVTGAILTAGHFDVQCTSTVLVTLGLPAAP